MSSSRSEATPTRVTISDSAGPILIVDDSDSDVMIARRCYEKSALGNPLVAMSSGHEVLAYMDGVLATRDPMPALILLDINMPTMDGFEALSRIRAHPALATIPIIMMLTNSDDPADIERSVRLGANGYQTKPVEMLSYIEFFRSLV